MRRLPLVCAFALVLAQGECFNLGCPDNSCQAHTTSRNLEILPYGETLTHQDTTCSTCGHANVTVNWHIQPPVFGTVDVTVQASCPANPACCAPESRYLDPSSGFVTFEPSNAKNLCGDNAPETYTVTVKNSTNDDLIDPVIQLICPDVNQPTGSALRPTAIGKK